MTDEEAKSILGGKGWGLIPPDQYRIDMEPEFLEIWEQVKNFTMTSVERGYALYGAVKYISRYRIPGEMVECGVWRGGSCMLMALTLQTLGETDRKIRLYDTFTGMTEPTEEDVIAWNGLSVAEKRKRELAEGRDSFASWAIGAGEVENNLLSTGYPRASFTLIPGDVEETLKEAPPAEISLLRLDTDWYSSTRAELAVLYPRLCSGGVLILDDYGHFQGARRAVDEYFFPRENSEPQSRPPFLHRIDYTGRMGIKP